MARNIIGSTELARSLLEGLFGVFITALTSYNKFTGALVACRVPLYISIPIGIPVRTCTCILDNYVIRISATTSANGRLLSYIAP